MLARNWKKILITITIILCLNIKKVCPEAEIIGHVEKFQNKEIIVV